MDSAGRTAEGHDRMEKVEMGRTWKTCIDDFYFDVEADLLRRRPEDQGWDHLWR